MIIDIIKQFLTDSKLCLDYTVQSYEWTELKDPVFNKYLVIMPQSDGSNDKESVVDNVRIVFVGDESTNKLKLNREVISVEEAFLNTVGMINNVYAFDLVGRSPFFRSKEGRPMFEINVRCNGVKYAC